MRACSGLVLLVPVLVGCGGAVYQPRPSPRLQIVPDGGGLAVVKSGRTIPLGFAGSDLDEAVKGNPRAEEEARSFQGKMIGGFVVGLIGSLAGGAGAAIVVGNEVSNNRSNDLRIAGVSLAVGGVVLALVSTLVTASAQKHIWNAINIYNDDLPPPWGYGGPRATHGPAFGPVQPGYAPPSYAPPGSAPPGYAPPSYAPPGSAPPGFAPPGNAPPGSAPPAYTPAPPPVAPPPAAPPPAAPPGASP